MQPAATLRVLVDADAAKATAQLAAFDRTLGLSAKRALSATKSYDKLGASTKGASGQLSLFDKNAVSATGSLRNLGDEADKTSTTVTRSFKRVKTAASATTHEFHRNERAILTLAKIPGALAGLGAITEGLAALTGGAAALTGALAPITGLAASGAQALTLYGQVAGTIALSGVNDLGSAVGGLNEKLDEEAEAFKNLSPNAQQFARELEKAKGPLRDIQRGVQGRLFGNLDVALEGAMRGLRNMQPILNQTADSIGKVAIRFSKWVGSDAFARDMTKIGESNNKVLRQLGGTLIRIGKAFVDVTVAARPLTEWIGRLFEKWSKGLRDAADAGRRSGDLAKFFGQTKAVTQDLIGIFKNVWGALRNILSLGAPLGREILDRLRIGARHLREWTETAEGRNSIKEFFQQIRRPLFEAGRLIAEFTKSFFRVGTESSGTLAPMLKAIRTDLLPILEKLVISTSKAFGPKIVELLTELAKHFLKLAGTSGPLNIWVETMTHITRGLNWLVSNIPGFQELIITLLGFKAVASAMALTKAATGVSILGEFLKFVKGFRALAMAEGAVTALSVALKGFGLTLRGVMVATGIGAVITAVVLLNEKFHFIEPVLKAIEKAAKAAFGWIKEAIGKVIEAIGPIVTKLGEIAFEVLKVLTWPYRKAVEIIIAVYSRVFGIVRDVFMKIVGAARDAFRWIRNAVGDVAGAFRDAWEGVAGFFEDVWNGFIRIVADALRFILGGVTTVTQALADMLSGLGGIQVFGVDLVPGADAAAFALQGVTDGINATRDALRQPLKPSYKELAREAGVPKDAIDDLGASSKKTAHTIQEDGKKTAASADRSGKDYADSTEKHHKRAKEVSQNQSEKAMNTVIANNDRMVNAVGRGHKILVENTSKAMKAFGARAVKFDVHIRESHEQRGPGMSTTQAGGFAGVVPGSGFGDKVHMQAMVEPGEGVFVLNRNAMGALQAFNAAVPRFQGGGIAGLQPGASSLAKALMGRFGGALSSTLRPGDTGSLHSTGQAFDWVGGNWAGAARYSNMVGPSLLEGIYTGALGGPQVSWDSGQRVPSGFWGGSTWAAHANHIHLAAAGAFGPAAKRIARVILTSSLQRRARGGPLVGMGQGSLDRVWKAANQRLRRLGTLGTPDLGAGAMSRGQIAGVWRRANKGLGNSRLMAAIALAESGGVPSAVGYDPGGTEGLGLWQVTTGFNDDLIRKYGGRNAMFDPMRNALAAGDIFARQGLTAWVVYNTGAYLQHMQRGGIAGLQGGGEPTATGPGGARDPRTRFTFPGWKAMRDAGRLQKRLGKTLRKIARTDERIQIQEALSGAATGPGGTAMTASEKGKQVALLQTLLGQLRAAKQISGKGMRVAERGLGRKNLSGQNRQQLREMREAFKSAHTEMAGLTGAGGRIFETSLALRELKAVDTSLVGGTDIASLLAFVEAAHFGVFGKLGTSGFASGGSVPASGKSVPVGGTGSSGSHAMLPNVEVRFADGMGWLENFMEVKIDGRIAETNRGGRANYRSGKAI